MRDIKQMSVVRLMGYSESLMVMIQNMTRFYKASEQCMLDGGITEREYKEIEKKIEEECVICEAKYNILQNELSRRMKHDLKLKKGIAQIDKMLDNMIKKYPYVGKSKEHIEILKEQERQKKANLKKVTE